MTLTRYHIGYLLMAFLLLALPLMGYGHGMSEEEKQSIIAGGNMAYLWLGATHMLSGYDHLAFVFGIIFFLTSFRDIAKYVTAFTLGHSVTLIYATFNAIQMNYFLIDAVIALSVCYIAFANLDGFRKYLNVNPPNMMLMIIGLGLIHGFGLSTRLQMLPLSEDHLLANIISFNVGVELGQISALAVMLVAIASWRNRDSFVPFSKIANYLLILGGIYLFFMQMHGYEHATNEELASPRADLTKLPGATAPSMVNAEVITLELPARGEMEYKLFLEQGGSLSYSWETDGTKLYFDLHGEPDSGQSSFKSYKTNEKSQDQGEITVPFTGTHGWYWNNTSREAVTITLTISGDYTRLDMKSESKQHDSIF